MDVLLDRLIVAPIADASLRALLDGAMATFYAFTLVLVRVSGLMLVGPLLGQSMVPINVRVLLVFVLTLLITPTLPDQIHRGFDQLDADRNRRLTRDEVPDHLLVRYEEQAARPGRLAETGITWQEWHLPPRMPKTLLDYLWIAAGELSVGLALGLGVTIFLSGLQLAGELIDQQTGTSLGQVFNPGLDLDASQTGQMLYMLGVAVFLGLEPISGHLLMVSTLVETFQTLPLGEAFLATGTVDLLRDLVHQSLVLAVQVAAPVLATMSLVALTMGFLGHTVPQINVLVIGFPVRALVALLVLTVSLSGAARAVVDLVPAVIDHLRLALLVPE